MTDDAITVPDYVPTDLQAEHVDAARERLRVATTEAGRPGVAPAGVRPPRTPDRPVSPTTIAAILLGTAGAVALTGVWSWLALMHDPMWWGFVGLGSALSVVLAGVASVLGVRALTSG